VQLDRSFQYNTLGARMLNPKQRRARFRYWYIGRFSGKFPVERKKDSFCTDFGAASHWSHCMVAPVSCWRGQSL
jgi:hypothetical protein